MLVLDGLGLAGAVGRTHLEDRLVLLAEPFGMSCFQLTIVGLRSAV